MVKVCMGDGVFIVDAGYRDMQMMKTIPGVRWSNKTSWWTTPQTWAALAQMRGTFGDSLDMNPEVLAWAWTERERVDSARDAKTVVVEGGYGFQSVGVGFLSAARSAMLADEMGLGKTRQAIISADLPCLVVCPNTMKYVWKAEFEKWRSGTSVTIVDGTHSQKQKALASESDVLIVNWEALRSYSRLAPYGSIRLTEKQKTPGPLNRPWQTVIADESHRAKDPHSQQTRALWAIGMTAARRIALTGTPVANSPADLWAQMHFVCPEEWPSYTAFIDRYCNSSLNFWGGLDVYSLKADKRAELDSFFEPRFLRRQKSEVLTQLPAKTYQTRLVSMAPAQKKVYEGLRKDMIALLDDGVLATFDPLVQTIRLLQTASAVPVLGENGGVEALTLPSCKVAALQELVDDMAGEPLVVFAASRKLIELCERELDVDLVTITGARTPSERNDAVAKFQTGNVPVALVTLGAGGEGITLSAAGTAVFLQRSWSLIENLQAEDRIHRIGQQSSAVNIIDIVTAETIEARVLEAFAGKEMTLADVVKDRSVLRSLL